MAFFGIAMILLLVYGIEFLDSRIQKKNDKDVEELHRKAYEWVDEHTDNPVLAVQRKAEIDKMVHDTVKLKGREYHPPTLKEMTPEDLAVAVVSMDDELSEEIRWHYSEHTEEEGREHLIQTIMKELGKTREEAEASADRCIESRKEWERQREI